MTGVPDDDKCYVCGCQLEGTAKSKDMKTGVCYECRRKALGFEIDERRYPRHNEMKDRHCLPRDLLMGPRLP